MEKIATSVHCEQNSFSNQENDSKKIEKESKKKNMGINGFNPFLKKKCPQAFVELPYSYFRGKRVAVDSDNVFFKIKARSYKAVVNKTDVCVEDPDPKQVFTLTKSYILEEIIKFRAFGIILIFVFDGKYIDEKSATQQKRREAKQKQIKAAEDLRQQILEYDELERTPSMVTSLRKKMHHLAKGLTPEEKEEIVSLLKAMGIPVLFATEEGEKLCASLCIEGYVQAVYSRDTDILAMGCPLSFSEEAGWIHNPKIGRTERGLKCVYFAPVLQALEMDYKTFLDLCIMGGCDFNSNMPGLALTNAFKALKKCDGGIDDLPEIYDEKKQILNHVRCREIFAKQDSKDICQETDRPIGSILNMQPPKLQLAKNYDEALEWLTEIQGYVLPEPSTIRYEKPPSLASSKLRLCMKGDPVVEKKETENKGDESKENEDPSKEIKMEDYLNKKPSPARLTEKDFNNLASKQAQNVKDKMLKIKEPVPPPRKMILKVIQK